MSDDLTRSDPATAPAALEVSSATLGQSRLRALIPKRDVAILGEPVQGLDGRFAHAPRSMTLSSDARLATSHRTIVAASVAAARVRILARPAPAPVAARPARAFAAPPAFPTDSDRAAIAAGVARSVRCARALITEAAPTAEFTPSHHVPDESVPSAASPADQPGFADAAIAEVVARSVHAARALIADVVSALPVREPVPAAETLPPLPIPSENIVDADVSASIEPRVSTAPVAPAARSSALVATPGPRQIEATVTAIAALLKSGALDARHRPTEVAHAAVRDEGSPEPPTPSPARSPSANARIAELAAALERVVPPTPSRSPPSVVSPSNVVAQPPSVNAAPPLIVLPQPREAPPPPPADVAADPPDRAAVPAPGIAPQPAPAPALVAPAAKPGGALPPSAVRIGRAKSTRPPALVAAAPPPSVAGDIAGPRGAAEWRAIQASLQGQAQAEPRTLPGPDPRPAPTRTTGGFVRRAAGVARRGASIVLRIAILAAMAAGVGWSSALLAYRFTDPPASTLMLAQQFTGRPITQRQVTLDRISPNLIRAVIASEDGNFCRHRGVDWGAIKEAVGKATEDGGRLRGASTISMQTVKNLMLWPQGHLLRKGLELPLAYLADFAWGKRRVLELYLNIAEWGPGVFGAEAAAQHHFRKSAAQLTLREAALLAVSLPNPIERNASRPGPGTQRLARLIETRSARPTLAVSCLGAFR